MPDKVGRYQIRGELGQGGMAAVYRAYDPRFGREVAVKLIHPRFAADEKLHLRFEREARTIAALEHPAIVPVYDFGEEAGSPYLVMRLMTGGSLKERLTESGPMSPAEVIELLRRVGPALDAAHAQGIVHRDLKPGNILFDRFEAPYLSDFGIVHLAESDATLTGQQSIGTPGYMSPEQIENQGVDSRTDIYALGVMIFQMFSGQLPYNATSAAMIMLKHMTEPVPDVHLINPAVPASFGDIVAVCMAKKKEERPASAAAVVAMLTDALARADTAVAGQYAVQEPAPPSGKQEPDPITLFPTRSTGSRRPVTPAARPEVASTAAGETEVALPDFAPVPPAQGEKKEVGSSRRWLWIVGGAGGLGVVLVAALALLFALGGDDGDRPVAEQGGAVEATALPEGGQDGAAAANPAAAAEAIEAGYAALDQGDPRDALRAAERCVGQAPEKVDCYLLRAEAFLALGEPGSALPNLNGALEREPDNVTLLSTRGFVLGELGRWDEAVLDLQRAVDLAPENGDRYLELAVTLIEAGRPERAAEVAEQCLTRLPEEPVCYQVQGEALRAAGAYQAAAAAYREAIRRDDRDPYLFVALGYALVELDQRQEARRAFENAVERDPENAALLVEVARVVAYDFEDAAAALLLANRATTADPEYATAFYAKAEAHRLLNQPARAVGAFRRFLELGGGESCPDCAGDARAYLEEYGEP